MQTIYDKIINDFATKKELLPYYEDRNYIVLSAHCTEFCTLVYGIKFYTLKDFAIIGIKVSTKSNFGKNFRKLDYERKIPLSTLNNDILEISYKNYKKIKHFICQQEEYIQKHIKIITRLIGVFNDTEIEEIIDK